MKRFFLILILALVIAPSLVFAVPCNGIPNNNLNLCYPSFGKNSDGTPRTLQLSTDLPSLIAWFYYAIVGLSGFAAFIMIVYGGIMWMTSAGNPSKITDARDRIEKALLGLLLVLASFLILQIINPEFTILHTPSV